MKKVLSTLMIAVLIISMAATFVVPASAAGEPLMLMTSHFYSIVEGDVGTLNFVIFPEYKNEKYHVAIYNEDGGLEGSTERTYYNSSTMYRNVNITVDTAELNLNPGRYTVKYYLSFYTLYDWHDEATVNSGYFNVVPNTCKGNHIFDEGDVWSEGDCDTKSKVLYTCSTCGYTESVETEFAHSWNNGTVLENATCAKEGKMLYTCTECDTTKEEAIGKKNHSWDGGARTEATCAAQGKIVYTCTSCKTTKTETIAKKNHAWDGGKEKTAPTSARAGVKIFTCSGCFTTRNESIPAVFTDVKTGEFYENAVDWAVEKKVTNGMTANTFAPDAKCTRGQIVTFLWRAAGSPEPTSTRNPFVDVKSNQYYYKAVLWAVEKGITNGMDATHFAPEATCTRGQVVTFLWRAKGKPAANTTNSFTDVKKGAYYYDAVLWAVKNGITNGMGNNKFAPDTTCTRGQIVTFLYRAYK